MNKSFLIFFTLGAIGLMVFAIYKSVYGEVAINSIEQSSLQIQSPTSVPISDTLAYRFFMDYHKSDSSEGSEGLLKNDNAAITQFYLDDAKIIEPLRQKAASLGKEFIGLSAVLGYNKVLDSHTIIWVAVVDADSGHDVVPELMLPKSNEKWDSYIYDYTGSCPKDCPQNSEMLWNQNWRE